MKKITLILFFYFFAIISNAQGRFNGYVVTNSNDTIKCTFSLEMNIFDKTLFYDSSLSKRAKIFKQNGEKVKYKPTELKTIFITGPKQGDYKFVSISEDKNHFFHEIISGKISYYIIYEGNLSGGFPYQRLFILKDGKLARMDGFSRRKTLGEFIFDYPELHQKWMDSNNYYKIDQFDDVIKTYNEHFKVQK